jgi:hypothetical protein
MLSRAVSCPAKPKCWNEPPSKCIVSQPRLGYTRDLSATAGSHSNQVLGKLPSRPLLECNGRAWRAGQDNSPPLTSTASQHGRHIYTHAYLHSTSYSLCPGKAQVRLNPKREEQRNIAAHRAINLPHSKDQSVRVATLLLAGGGELTRAWLAQVAKQLFLRCPGKRENPQACGPQFRAKSSGQGRREGGKQGSHGRRSTAAPMAAKSVF